MSDKKTDQQAAEELVNNLLTPSSRDATTEDNDPYSISAKEAVDLFLAGAAHVRSELSWISVEDRLPEENEQVLVTYIYRGVGRLFEGGRYHSGHWVQLQGEDVTHWMPIPPVKEQQS